MKTDTMNKPLRLLLVEDSEDDALLLERRLRKGGYDLTVYQRVESEQAFRDALQTRIWDIVITDYSLPGFDGLTALEVFKTYDLDVPFLIVSGTIGENVAVTAMKAGAHDYLMKENLARLVPAVERELNDAETRRAQRKTEEQVRKLSRAVEQSPSAVIIVNTSGVIEYVNPRFTTMTGYAAEDVLGRDIGVFRDGYVFPAIYDHVWECMQADREWKGEIHNRRKDGSQYWVSMTVSGIKDSEGNVTHYLVLQEETTQRRETEDALRESEARFRQLVEQAADSILVVNRAGKLRGVNQHASEVLGYTRTEMMGLDVFAIDPDVSPQTLDDIWQQVDEGVVTLNSHHRCKDGTIFPVEIRIAGVDQNGEQMLLAIARDMTERERFQQTLEQYNEQLEDLVYERTQQLERNIKQMQAILESSSDAIALAEANGDIRARNPAFKAMFGRQVYKAIEDILSVLVEPEHIERVTRALFTVLKQGEAARAEARMTRQDGLEMDVDIAMTPVKGPAGDTGGIVVSLRDITHLKEVERFKSRFVANAAHDLANPISNIKLHLYALENAPDRMARYMPILHSQTKRMENLVNDLRMLSQLDRGMVEFRMESIDLHRLLQDILRVHEPRAQSQQQVLSVTLEASHPIIMADHGKLERVIVNLLSNALNYTPEGGVIDVSTGDGNGKIYLRIQDSGIGIGEDELPHIFERFYRSDTAKLSGVQGTGLGLAIVKEIVEAHKGQIEVESVLDQGTTFTVCFPCGGA